MLKAIKSLAVGARLRWWTGIQKSLSAIGLMWLLTEVSAFLFPAVGPWFETNSDTAILTLSIVALSVFLGTVHSPRQVEFEVPTTQTKLTIKYGNVFDEDADVVIAVNEFFDGALGNVVSPTSVHGQFVIRYFNSAEAGFRQAVDPILASFQGTQQARAVQPDLSFPIGTTVKVSIGQKDAYLVALTTTDLQTHKATTTVGSLWIALTNMLDSVPHLSGGRGVAMPLIGNGLSGLNLQPQHLLRLLVLAIVMTSRRIQLPNSISIVLHEDCFDKLDLLEIRRNWRV